MWNLKQSLYILYFCSAYYLYHDTSFLLISENIVYILHSFLSNSKKITFIFGKIYSQYKNASVYLNYKIKINFNLNNQVFAVF